MSRALSLNSVPVYAFKNKCIHFVSKRARNSSFKTYADYNLCFKDDVVANVTLRNALRENCLILTDSCRSIPS